MRTKLCFGLASSLVLAMAAAGEPAHAQVSVNLEEAASGVTAPMMMVSPPGDDRRFIVRAERSDQDPHARWRDPGRAVPRHHRQDHRRSGRSSTRRACSASRSIRTSPTTASSTSPTARRPSGRGALDKHFWWSHTNVIEEYTVSADDPNVADPTSVRARSRRSTGRSSTTTATGSASARTACSISRPVTAATPTTGASATT